MSVNEDISRRLKDKEKKIKEFSELLETLSSMDDKRKSLWKEIYTNAVTDRENAYALYLNAYSTFNGHQSEHIDLGPTMVKYIERMTKANDQILKLAEIIKSTQEEENLKPEDLFDKIAD